MRKNATQNMSSNDKIETNRSSKYLHNYNEEKLVETSFIIHHNEEAAASYLLL